MAGSKVIPAILTVIACNLLAMLEGLGKLLVQDGYAVVEVIWARHFFFLVVLGPTLLGGGLAVPPPCLLIRHVGRALLPLAGAACVVVALKSVPLANVAALLFVGPIMLTILAARFLSERIGLRQWGAVVCGLMGILVIVSPRGSLGWTTLLPLMTALLMAWYEVLTRQLAGAAQRSDLLFWNAFIGTIVSSLLLPFEWKQPSADAWMMLAALGGLYALSQYAWIRAVELERAANLAPFGYFKIIGSVVIGYVAFNEPINAQTAIGIALIVAAGCYVCRARPSPQLR